MRHCSRERIKVYESYGKPLPKLLRKAAKQVEELGDDPTYTIHVHYDSEFGYLVTLYASV